MALITKPNTFQNGLTADATQVNSNFDTIINDYNGNVTDANIATSGITTYGKVNASAISSLGSVNAGAGTLPVANLPTGTTANKLVVLDGSAKLPAVDGSQLTGLTGFGAWSATKTKDTVYQAATDGIITCSGNYVNAGSPYNFGFATDASNPPTTLRIHAGHATDATGQTNIGVTCPVRKGDYYNLITNNFDPAYYFFLPIGA